MSADQTNIASVTPVPGGGYHGVTADGSPIYDLAMRTMQETGAKSVRVQLWAEEPGVENPFMITGVIDRSGAIRVVSRGPGVPPANPNN
ncbi:hypothetical protein NW761_012699 [Fusarium oxysporum]|uniref:Uncharacterized protein n=1 Tax=Fusarium oxysporum f. sp. pisi HDV247 TaxID=1080344 RepID=W9NZH0_FUSOX|nr:hypothetical protein FOVG_10176 [Fusarium oxysporum f. sp. pisi HDV247]KAJ4033177.1 hypothetical protein NW758_011617 [Fusarium oxysporum]KAJ4045446.1 hypothetical protein NW763_010559 [Fusarium oxysporum]KAJ4046542.1 hypothetical protein NW753_009363 [Fusarium oxysporum]KAJ4075268.1 hypothetical protein NW756_013489 [Fusarium oxysporum]